MSVPCTEVVSISSQPLWTADLSKDGRHASTVDAVSLFSVFGAGWGGGRLRASGSGHLASRRSARHRKHTVTLL